MYSAKAFGILVQSNEQEEYWEGLRGACVGAFQNIIEGKESEDNIEEILILLGSCNNPQVKIFLAPSHTCVKKYKVISK